MRKVEEITAYDMNLRFARGEFCSEHYKPHRETLPAEMSDWLWSDDPVEQMKGVGLHLECRDPTIRSFPRDTKWYLAKLATSHVDFSQLRTLNDPKWNARSGAGRHLVVAAEHLMRHPGEDSRVEAIIEGLRLGEWERVGLTLLGQSVDGPWTIVEGTARLVALYLLWVRPGKAAPPEPEVDVVLGTSEEKWSFAPA